MNNYPDVQEGLKIMEHGWKQLAGVYKAIVVKLMPEVIWGNASSNMWVAMRHGIGPVEYAKAFTTHWSHLTSHLEMSEELLGLEFQKDAGIKGLDTKIKSLKDRISRNPMDTLLKDGQFSLILEDLDVSLVQKKTHMEDKLDEYVKKAGRKGEIFDSTRKALYLTKDTSVHKAVEKLTIYNDIINRSIILEKLNEDLNKVKFKSKDDRPSREREILNYVDQLFVNYSYLDNKYLKYANDMDILMFTKYFFRAAKAVRSMYARHPLGSIGFEVIDQGIINVADPMEQYFSPIDSLANRAFKNPLDIVWEILFPNIFNPLK